MENLIVPPNSFTDRRQSVVRNGIVVNWSVSSLDRDGVEADINARITKKQIT